MKLFVKLQDKQNSKEFLEELVLLQTRFEKLFIHLNLKDLELMIQGEFYLATNYNGYWIEDDDYCYLNIPRQLVQRFVIKEE